MNNQSIQGIIAIISMAILIIWLINSFQIRDEQTGKPNMHYFYALNISFMIMISLCIWVLIYLKSP